MVLHPFRSTLGCFFDRPQTRSLERARVAAHFRIFRDVIDLERFVVNLGVIFCDFGGAKSIFFPLLCDFGCQVHVFSILGDFGGANSTVLPFLCFSS